MDRLTEAAALLTMLARRKGGWSALADEVDHEGSAVRIFEQLQGQHAYQPNLFSSAGDDDLDPFHAARQAIDEWQLEGMQLVTVLDDHYPAQLRTIHQRPPFLLYRGDLQAEDAGGVAVVGTRNPSAQGLERAGAIAGGLAERGVTVVSGLAAGIDTAAHHAALDAGGRTVAVIGTGLRRVYPAANRSLQERIAAEHAVISQFWPDASPTKTSFPMRNAVMSGYSAATVVIEAAWRSGARMQARLALEHGRPVFLLETLLAHDWAREYVRRGAMVVRSVEELLTALADRLSVTELVWA